MSFSVWPWLRQWHNFWLSKPFGLDIAALDPQSTRTDVSLHYNILHASFLTPSLLEQFAAALVWHMYKQLHNLIGDCARELLKSSRLWKFSSLQQKKKNFGFRFFVSDVINGVGFRSFWLRLPGLGPKLLDRSILLKFLLEIRLESASF